jgi:hypothetical protein
LKIDTRGLAGDDSDSSDDESSPGMSPPSVENTRTSSERQAFLFGLNLTSPDIDLRKFHPLPSQIPFLLDVFDENVNYFIRIVHVPTMANVVRNWRNSGMTNLTPGNEALLFSIYFATISSMEEDDVSTLRDARNVSKRHD